MARASHTACQKAWLTLYKWICVRANTLLTTVMDEARGKALDLWAICQKGNEPPDTNLHLAYTDRPLLPSFFLHTRQHSDEELDIHCSNAGLSN
jgi:hypothetical protein